MSPTATSTTVTIPFTGRFSLERVATLGFGHRHEDRFDGVMRLSFCLDGHGYGDHGAATVTQDAGGVHCSVVAGDPSVVIRQVARVLSLDHDGAVFDRIGRRDPVIGRLQDLAPGLRPPLFYSPYEAAAWAVLSARRSSRQMTAVRRRLAEAYGATFELAGMPTPAFPTPAQLLRVRSFPGLDDVKISRLHGVARAALEGWLDAAALQTLGPEAATAKLQTLAGIGPFYAALVVVRGAGFDDVLAVDEPKLRAAVGDLYQLGHAASAAELTEIAEGWRPRRTWASVLVRATSGPL